jgi:protein-tyrosine phosphatase
MTDLHCHILPGIDDGAKNEDISVALLKKEYEDGIKQVVLTSHFYPERVSLETFLAGRLSAFESLQEALSVQSDGAFFAKIGSDRF